MNIYEKLEYLEKCGWKINSNGTSITTPNNQNMYMDSDLERLISYCYDKQMKEKSNAV